jgi:16S rRNA (cytidine1402-2'-O)-methyltransferase
MRPHPVLLVRQERIRIQGDGPGWLTLVRYWLKCGGGAAEPASRSHALFLIPWSIGNRLDITLNAVRCVRRLRCFLSEDPDLSREQFAFLLGAGVSGKRFLRIPDEPEAGFLRTALGLLKDEDVGLVSGGGSPCFVDPGAWVVREVRKAGIAVTALSGPSGLTTVLSLSGIESRGPHPVFSFAYFSADSKPGRGKLLAAAGRADEPLVVFLGVKDLPVCLRALAPVVADREVSVFFDLTRGPQDRFPYADQVRTMTCQAWLKDLGQVHWSQVADISLLVHPRAGDR